MPVDSSIYFQQQIPDIVGSIDKGLRMSDMIQQRQKNIATAEKEMAIEEAYKSGVVQNSDGSFSMDRKTTLSNIFKADPRAAMQADESFRKQDQENNKLKFENQKKTVDAIASVIPSIKDQNSYNSALAHLKNQGVDVSQIDSVYDPKVIQMYGNQVFSAKERMDNQFKQQELNLKQQQIGMSHLDRRDSLQLKQNDKLEKRKLAMNEIEDRRQNINASISKLDDQIDEYGTYEMFGSQNQDMERNLDQIATDMAKLMDPSSVARPSEVDQIKDGLIRSGFKNSNSTAREILKNFKSEVERRADAAYKIRGLEKPQSISETKNINGVEYIKVNGGWKKQNSVVSGE